MPLLLKRFLLARFFRTRFDAEEMIAALDRLVGARLSLKLDVGYGCASADLEESLRGCELRIDKQPIPAIHAVISAVSWPRIERFVFVDSALNGVIYEFGLLSGDPNRVFSKVGAKLLLRASSSIDTHYLPGCPVPIVAWQYCGHYCFLRLLMGRSRIDCFRAREIFHADPSTTFIFAPGTPPRCLSTVALGIARDSDRLANLSAFLERDLILRAKCVDPLGALDGVLGS